MEAGIAELGTSVRRYAESLHKPKSASCGVCLGSTNRYDCTTGPLKVKVSEKDVAYVADLANLELSADERIAMVRDLNSILDYMDMLNELDTSNVEPMAQVSDRYGVDASKQGSERFAYTYRDDVPEGLRKSLSQEAALENAPDTDGTFFRVPKVIER
jgi:aspartyl-tRNA(Asn)/glutamyl-tRNA(Gln) amidotransferase subunit C